MANRFKVIERIKIRRKQPGLIRAWTIQPLRVWEQLQERGQLFAEPDLATMDFIEAYDWMKGQMRQRLPRYQGHYPWWFFIGKKHDLKSWYNDVDEQAVRMEMAFEKEDILISHFDAWHMVLNNTYLPVTAEEDDEFERRAKSFSKAHKEKLIRNSWERIFSPDLLTSSDWSEGVLQGCVGALDIESVLKVELLAKR